MKKIDFALLCDGDSDHCLLPILKWLLRRFFVDTPINGKLANLSKLWEPPKKLPERIRKAIELTQPDLLFIHRDAEAQEPRLRFEEISKAISEVKLSQPEIFVPFICVVPIRMTEAWLLFDECAIRKAAGNPNGKLTLDIPAINSIETIPKPKEKLYSLLKRASELRGRQEKSFNLKNADTLLPNIFLIFHPYLPCRHFRS